MTAVPFPPTDTPAPPSPADDATAAPERQHRILPASVYRYSHAARAMVEACLIILGETYTVAIVRLAEHHAADRIDRIDAERARAGNPQLLPLSLTYSDLCEALLTVKRLDWPEFVTLRVPRDDQGTPVEGGGPQVGPAPARHRARPPTTPRDSYTNYTVLVRCPPAPPSPADDDGGGTDYSI